MSSSSATHTKKPQADVEHFHVQVTWKRWLMLGLFLLLAMMNAVQWISFSSIAVQTVAYYGVTSLDVDMTSNLFAFVYIPVILIAPYLLERFGLYKGLVFAGLLTVAGAWLRILAVNPATFGWIWAGQILAAVAQPIIMVCPTVVSNTWFPSNERTLATTIASVANNVGTAIGFVVPAALVGQDPTRIPSMLTVLAIASSVITLILILGFRSRPEHAPSVAAHEQESHHTSRASIIAMLRNPNFWIVFATFSVALGSFSSLATLLDQLLVPYGYHNTFNSLLGALTVLVGLVGAAAAGIYVDKTLEYKRVIAILMGGVVVALLAFSLFMRPGQEVELAVVASFLGFTMTPLIPLCLELSVEVSHPAGEAAPSGLLMFGGQITSFVYVFAGNSFIEKGHTEWVMYMLAGTLLICAPFFLFVLDARLLRHQSEVDAETNQERSPLVVST